jgi:hypothetical protein
MDTGKDFSDSSNDSEKLIRYIYIQYTPSHYIKIASSGWMEYKGERDIRWRVTGRKLSDMFDKLQSVIGDIYISLSKDAQYNDLYTIDKVKSARDVGGWLHNGITLKIEFYSRDFLEIPINDLSPDKFRETADLLILIFRTIRISQYLSRRNQGLRWAEIFLL